MMKKQLFSSLLVLSLMVIGSHCYAGTISISPFISGNDVTIPRLETQRTTIQNVINGNIEGGGINIKAGSVQTIDLSQAISPITRWDETFNDYTVSGMLPVTDAGLSSNISAGVSYVDGYRISLNATSHTYTASKDTYVYVHSGGYYVFQEVANGASAPSTPSNTLLLAKAITSGAAITSVSDLRTTAIQITANNSNFPLDYRNQAIFVPNSGTTGHVEPGQVAIGNTLYTNTSDLSTKSTGTATNWIEGSVPNLNNLKFYTYAYNNSGTTYDFKYSSADPVYSDSSSNANGTLRYYTNSSVTYRALAWISADSTGVIKSYTDGSGTTQYYNFGQLSDTNTENTTTFSIGAVSTGTTIMPDDDTIPQINEGDEYMNVTFRPTSLNSYIYVKTQANASNGTRGNLITALFQDTTANALTSAQVLNATGGFLEQCHLEYRMRPASLTPIVFRVRVGYEGAGTTTFNGVAGARKFGGSMNSYITVTEKEA